MRTVGMLLALFLLSSFARAEPNTPISFRATLFFPTAWQEAIIQITSALVRGDAGTFWRYLAEDGEARQAVGDPQRLQAWLDEVRASALKEVAESENVPTSAVAVVEVAISCQQTGQKSAACLIVYTFSLGKERTQRAESVWFLFSPLHLVEAIRHL